MSSVAGFTICSFCCLKKLAGPISILIRGENGWSVPGGVRVLVQDVDVLVVANLDDSDEVLVLGAWWQCDSSLLFHYIFSDLIGKLFKG